MLIYCGVFLVGAMPSKKNKVSEASKSKGKAISCEILLWSFDVIL